MGRPQYRIRRKIATIPFQAGTPVTYDLPRDYDYEAIGVRITGSVQVTTGATSVRAEAPCQLVNRVEVIADGKNTLVNAPFWFLSLANYPRALLQNGARVTTPPTAASNATYPVEAYGVIDFMTVDGVHPKDSNFRPSGLSLFQIRLTFGQALDIFVPGAGVAVPVAGLAVEVFGIQVVEQPDANGNYSSPIALKKVSFQNINVPANNSGQEIRLPAGNFIKSVVFRGEGGTAGEPSIGVINNLILQNGIDVRFNLTGPQTRNLNNGDYGYMVPGYYVTDFLTKGRADANLSELWDVSNPAEPKAIVDVTGAAINYVSAGITEYIMAGAQ